jgi:hypothetical protein
MKVFVRVIEAIELMSTWIDIAVYREFWDVPRMFVVVVEDRTVLFDGSFDEALDEYPDDYKVYLLHGRPVAELPHDWSTIPDDKSEYLGRIAVVDVEFDSSRRKQIRCADLEKLISPS